MTPIGRFISVTALLCVVVAVALFGAIPVMGLLLWPAIALILLLLFAVFALIFRPKLK